MEKEYPTRDFKEKDIALCYQNEEIRLHLTKKTNLNQSIKRQRSIRMFFIFRKIKKELWNEWNPPTFHGGIYSCESFGF